MSGPRVLIVDDNQAFGENLTEILEGAGYHAAFATSVNAALGLAKSGFDLALVDVRLPDGDGTELAGRLKTLNPDGEVVMLTGFATLETATAAVRSGAFAYLMKPCAMDQLLLTLQQAMRQVLLLREKRELARRAQVNERLAAVGTMTAGLSHEIRNPLNSAGLQLAVLERRVQSLDAQLRPPLLEPLQLVQGEIRRLEHILQDFLQFARPTKLHTGSVPLDSIVNRVLDLLEAEVERRGVHIERKLAPVTARGDDERLQQVILNICLNAIEAMAPGGSLSVVTALDGQEAVVGIEDTGPGISEENLKRLFEPFFTTKALGSGLGLPIAHAIVQQHDGTINVRNLEKGGARFDIRLPVA